MDVPKELIEQRVKALEAQREQARQVYWQIEGAIAALTDLLKEQADQKAGAAEE